MPRTVIGKRKRAARIGHLRDRVVVQERDITEPLAGSADFDELFAGSKGRWSNIKTVSGRILFLGAQAGEVAITHEVVMRFDPDITTENWLLLDTGERLKIEKANDLENRHQWLTLLCVSRGFTGVEASKA